MTFDRNAALTAMADGEVDVLVVGGGITGAGVALDAAARGLSTGLVERYDFASGTSSKSSKLVHGGLRYLQQKEYRLVYENLAERQRLLENAPHLVKPLPFLIPLFGRDGAVNRAVAKAYNTALWLYDVTGGIRIGKLHKRIDRDDALRHFPTLRPELLVAAFIYYDAQADDARLTLEVARTAALDFGASIANYSPVTGIVHDDAGRAAGVVLEDGTQIAARAVVNATGVWVDEIRGMDEAHEVRSTRPAKGVHVTLPRSKLPCDIAAVLPVPKDRRSVFVVPWGEFVYVGTTDTDYDGPLDDPHCTDADVAYLLGAVNSFVTDPVAAADVVGTWAGLRPLLREEASERTADLSRRHGVTVSSSGLVTITGGKLTTYRKMAADTVDAVGEVLGRKLRRSPTKSLRLRGAEGYDEGLREDVGAGLDTSTMRHLADRYGGEARVLAAMVSSDGSLGRPLVPGLPYIAAEAVYAVRYEMAQTLDDVLSRRTRAVLLDRDATVAAADDAAALLAPELGWDDDETARQISRFRTAAGCDRQRPTAAGTPNAGD